MNILIYDQVGSHYNKIASIVEHFSDFDHTIHRFFVGTAGNFEEQIIDFCVENSIDVVYIPYSSLPPPTGTKITRALNIPVLKPYFAGFVARERVYRSVINFTGGDTEPNVSVTHPLLDFYAETETETGEDRYVTSWAGAKLTAFVAYLLSEGYDMWQARQILRQNANGFQDWTVGYGFGKITAANTNEIIIPETILTPPPVDVVISEPFGDIGEGSAFLDYFSQDGLFRANGGVVFENPTLIVGPVSETFDYSTEYGSEFASTTVDITEEYTKTQVPKRPSVFFWGTGANFRRVSVGRDAQGVIEGYRDYDRISAVRVYDARKDLIATFDRGYFVDEVLFEPINNPVFSLTNSGNGYFLQFQTENAHGVSAWTELMYIVDDESYKGVFYDYRGMPSHKTKSLIFNLTGLT